MPPKKKAPPKLAAVTTLYETNFREIPDTMRVIAQRIEEGAYGEVKEGVVVLFGANGLEIFGLGVANHDGGTSHLMLSAAANKLANTLIYYGEQEE